MKFVPGSLFKFTGFGFSSRELAIYLPGEPYHRWLERAVHSDGSIKLYDYQQSNNLMLVLAVTHHCDDQMCYTVLDCDGQVTYVRSERLIAEDGTFSSYPAMELV